MRWWTFLLLTLVFFSCASGRGSKALSCKRTTYKAKNYKIKKLNAYQKQSYSVSSSSPSSNESALSQNQQDVEDVDPIHQEAISTIDLSTKNDVHVFEDNTILTSQENNLHKYEEVFTEPVTIDERSDILLANQPKSKNQQEPKQVKPVEKQNKQTAMVQVYNEELEVLEEIPFEIVNNQTQETKTIRKLESKTTQVDLEESMPDGILLFREQKIDVSKGYSFDEIIPFVINQDQLLNPEEAYQQIEDLAILLIENPHVKVTIKANTATDEPHPSHQYGGDEETLTSMWEQDIDQDGFTLRDLMVARSNRIIGILVANGVNRDQLNSELGTHNMWKYQRFVTFILNEEE